MGTGNSDVGAISDIITPITAKRHPLGKCQGAMSQQTHSHGYNATQQMLVRLVGYRDPNGRPQSWDRLRSAPKLGEPVE